ncbi:MAG: putative drug exporter of the superfamily [Gaiellaceae bacterium]|nr:putative drug exporter of the superfamily [Gaiellaceae bacterium]
MSEPRAQPELPAGPVTRAYGQLVTWLAPVLVAVVAVGTYGAYHFLPSIASAPNATTDSLLPQHPASLAVEQEAARIFGAPFDTPYLVVQRNPAGLSAADQKQSVLKAVRVDQGKAAAEFRGVAAVPILNTLGIVPGSREHDTTIVTYLYFPRHSGSGTALDIANAYASYLGPGLDTVGVTGAMPARIEQFRLLQSRLTWTEIATVLLILFIVGIALRAVLAPLLTVLAAGIAFVISQHALGWIGQHSSFTMPSELTGVAVALMLGIVTDYSVFYFSTARELLREGASSRDAVRRSTVLNTPIVMTAGVVVSLGVACLMLGTLGFFRSFGPGMAVTVATGLVVSVLLIPACLRLFGRALFWPGLRGGAAPHVGQKRTRLARFLTAKPVALVAAVAAFAVLGLAASPLAGGLPLGLQLVQGLPSDDPVAVAAQAAGDGFAPGVIAPTELLLRAPGIELRRNELARLQTALAGEPHVAGVVGPADQPSSTHLGLAIAPHGGAARYGLIFDSDPTEAGAIAHLRRVERDLPALLERAGLGGVNAGWGGETALGIETVDATDTSLWRVIAAAFAVNFLLLLLFLRSLLAPLYLLLASAAALAATFGITVYVFTDVLHTGMSYYLPVAFSALLLSLGSDYNIFVVGRVWKETERQPLREAVATAVPQAGRAITVAGLALALSFTCLAIIPITPFAVMAFAMGVGILLDTFLVRSVLVPALIILFGRTGLWPRRECVPEPVPGAAEEPLVRSPERTGHEADPRLSR